jgi:colicin import membrane protein
MTNSFVGFLNSIFVHLFLLAILTIDFSIFVPQKDRINTIPIEFVTFPIEKENNLKKIENIKNESIEKNIRKKVLIEDSKVDKKKQLNFDSKRKLEDQIAETKLLKERREVQITIALIQDRINSIWKKPSLGNKNIQSEFLINLAPSGEILSYDLISSSGDKVFDESALAALSSISFITEVIGLDRKYFERNFRSFNLVFKSKN